MDYDASGNLAWSAAGLGSGFAGTSACNRETVPAAEKSLRSYDARNRLTYIDHPPGTADVSYSYYADGAPWTVASSDGGTWTYSYNKRRLLTGESLNIDAGNGARDNNGNGVGSRKTARFSSPVIITATASARTMS